MDKVALYAGSFDPFTNGHLNIVQRSLKLFDQLHIVIATSPSKNSMFSIKKRQEMITKHFTHESRITVGAWDGLLVDYAKKFKINFLIRGLRPTGDFESEFQMASMNKKLNKEIETYFLMTEDDHYFVSSSLVKEIFKHGGDIAPFIPNTISQYLKRISK